MGGEDLASHLLQRAPCCPRGAARPPDRGSPQPKGQQGEDDPDHVRDLQHARHVCRHPGCPLPVCRAVPPVSSWTPVTVSPTVSPSTRVMLSPTPLSVLTWLAVSSPTTSWRSSPRGATPSPPPLSARLSVTSRRSSATSPLTSSRRCPPLLPPPPSRNLMSFPTARSSPSATRGSGAPRPSSSLPSSEWRLVESTRPPTTPS